MSFGMSDGFEPVHYLLEEAFVDGAYGKEISYTFLRGVENALHFDTNPIYALLHEPCYCEGTACNWSAERVRAEFPEFAITPDRPVLFTGEMVYPWMFDDYRTLRPLKEAAHILAQFDGWPQLYDKEVLRQNTVPTAAAMYYNDMYVDRLLSEEAACIIKGMRRVGHQRIRTQWPARRRRENVGTLVRNGTWRNLRSCNCISFDMRNRLTTNCMMKPARGTGAILIRNYRVGASTGAAAGGACGVCQRRPRIHAIT